MTKQMWIPPDVLIGGVNDTSNKYRRSQSEAQIQENCRITPDGTLKKLDGREYKNENLAANPTGLIIPPRKITLVQLDQSNRTLAYKLGSGSVSTIALATGDYQTHTELAAALQTAIRTITGCSTCTVSYSTSARKFTIANTHATLALILCWYHTSSTIDKGLFGFHYSVSIAAVSGTGVSEFACDYEPPYKMMFPAQAKLYNETPIEITYPDATAVDASDFKWSGIWNNDRWYGTNGVRSYCIRDGKYIRRIPWIEDLDLPTGAITGDAQNNDFYDVASAGANSIAVGNGIRISIGSPFTGAYILNQVILSLAKVANKDFEYAINIYNPSVLDDKELVAYLYPDDLTASRAEKTFDLPNEYNCGIPAKLSGYYLEVVKVKGDGTALLWFYSAEISSTKRKREDTVATITTSAAHGFKVGQAVYISGLGGTGYNGTHTILATPTATTFTFSTGIAENETEREDTGGDITIPYESLETTGNWTAITGKRLQAKVSMKNNLVGGSASTYYKYRASLENAEGFETNLTDDFAFTPGVYQGSIYLYFSSTLSKLYRLKSDVKYINLYRTKMDENVFYLIAKIPVKTEFSDSKDLWEVSIIDGISDTYIANKRKKRKNKNRKNKKRVEEHETEGIETSIVADLLTQRDPMPPFRKVVYWDNRLWGIGKSDARTVIYFSRAYQPESFDLGNQFVKTNDEGFEVMDMAELGDRLVFITEGGIGMVVPVGDGAYSPQNMKGKQVGTKSRNSAVSVLDGSGNAVYFQGSDGHFYRTDGLHLECITQSKLECFIRGG